MVSPGLNIALSFLNVPATYRWKTLKYMHITYISRRSHRYIIPVIAISVDFSGLLPMSAELKFQLKI